MQTFLQKKPFIIGMVHIGSLTRPRSAEEREALLMHAKQDTEALVAGGVNGVMFENMYDYPHTERLDADRRTQFQAIVKECAKGLSIPFGLSVLWNDYESAFQIAKETGASWVRVPVFIDSVETAYGTFHADPEAVRAARAAAHAEQVQILADIQVKHATMLSPRSIAASAQAAEQAGADGIIVTGTWTGEPASKEDVEEAARTTNLPLFIGSGVTEENVQSYMEIASGAIIGTALKETEARPTEEERLRTSEEARVSMERVRAVMQKCL